MVRRAIAWADRHDTAMATICCAIGFTLTLTIIYSLKANP